MVELLSGAERAAAAEAGLAVFEDRIILEAQPPVGDEALRAVQEHCAGPLPEALISLWRTAFGGELDYDLRCDFGDHEAQVSFNELFHPGSDGYHDLWGWIEHERDLAEDAARRRGEAWSGRLRALPIGGFEYLDRIYVVVAEGRDHGRVLAWMQGLPPGWQLGDSHDALGTVADDVRGLFRALALEHDPWVTDDETSGAELVHALDELRATGGAAAGAAATLTGLVRRSVVDWRAAVEDGTVADHRLLRRLALEHAVAENDARLLDRLVGLGCDPVEELLGSATPLDVALRQGSADAVRWLLDRDVPVRNAIRSGAHAIDADLARELLRRGATVDVHAVSAALDADRLDVAHLLSRELPGDGDGGGPVAARIRMLAAHAAQTAERRPSPDTHARATLLREIATRVDATTGG